MYSKCYRYLLSMIFFSLALNCPLGALKRLEMPADFGQKDWVKDNWQEAVGYLKYIADSDIRQRLLSVPEELRLKAWKEYWIKYDPVISTPVNEYRQEYFSRIKYANEHFGTIHHPFGWLTDRGQAYIRMGPPRNIETYTTEFANRNIQVWDYWSSDNTTLFFWDYAGDGNYYLLNPTELEQIDKMEFSLAK